MIFYHGTASTFEKLILKHGLRKKRGGIWNRLAARDSGKRCAYPSAVWCTPDYQHAVDYARLGAAIMRAEHGEEVDLGRGYAMMAMEDPQIRRYIKLAKVYDRDAEPIVFGFDVEESEEGPILTFLHEYRLHRAIPPE